MKSARIVLALLAWCWSTPSSPLLGAAPPLRALVITGVTVIDATGKPPQPDTTVLICGARISALGPTGVLAIPAGAQVVDGRGKYLIPGLWDMHAHLTDSSFGRMYLAHGVTGVRHMFSTNPWYSPRWDDKARKAGKRLFPRLVAAERMLEIGRAHV